MKLGAMQGVLGGGDDATRFARAKRLGFTGVEPDLALEDVRDARGPRVEALVAAKAETGLTVPSICLGYQNDRGFVAEPGRTAEIAGEIRVAIEIASALKAGVILVPFFFKNDPKGDAAKLARVAEVFKPLCAEAAGRGVTLCYEGTLTAEELHEMAGRIGSERGFGVYFDLANVVWKDMDGPEQIRKTGTLIRQVHMKETKVGPGDVRPGLGRVKYPESAAALKAIGYDGWLVMETPGGTDEQVAGDVGFTRKYFAV